MKDRRFLLALFASLIVLASVHESAFMQAQQGRRARQETALAEPFQGVTTDGTVMPNLYSIKATGVSTEPIRNAASRFLSTLSEAQRQATTFPADDLEWRRWNNVHRAERLGISFKEMNAEQRKYAWALISASLSPRGYKQTQDIMALNGALAEITGRLEEYGQGLYWITVMGEPSETSPWGWQLDGHHLVINYFVLADQVVMTPTFMGSEPVSVDSGAFAGTVVLQDEQNKGLALAMALNDEQRGKAVIQTEKSANNALAQAYNDNLVLDYAGIRAAELTQEQQGLLLETLAAYVNNMREGHARIRMEEVRRHLDATYFAWVGDIGSEAVFYYRIHSPVVLIEFDHQTPVALEGPRVPDRKHVHSVIRTPNGNDYGKDLLRQHYQRSHGLGSNRNAD